MNDDQLFDEMIRMKTQQRHFEGVDAGWQKMQQQLPPEKTRLRASWRTGLVLCLFAALASGGCISFFLQAETEVHLNRNAAMSAVLSPVPQSDPESFTALSNSGCASQEISSQRNDFTVADKTAHPHTEHGALLNTNAQPVYEERTNTSFRQPTVSSTGNNTDVRTISLPAAEAKSPALALLSTSAKTGSVSAPVQWSPQLGNWVLQGGMTYTASLSGNAGNSSFNPVLGIGYNIWLNPAWSLQAGVRYSSIGNVSDIAYTAFTASSPETAEYSNTQLHRLHTLSLPLQVWRRTGYRHAFHAGYTLNFIVGVQQEKYSYTETNGIISNRQTLNSFARSGFSRFDGLFTAGYSYTISSHLQAEVSVYSGVTDIMHNSVYGNRFERNRGAQLLLSYSFR